MFFVRTRRDIIILVPELVRASLDPVDIAGDYELYTTRRDWGDHCVWMACQHLSGTSTLLNLKKITIYTNMLKENQIIMYNKMYSPCCKV